MRYLHYTCKLAAMKTRIIYSLSLLCFLGCTSAIAEEDSDGSTDEEKQQEEAKKEAGGKFLALPFFVTEPAIGEGLGAGLVYFHANRHPDTPKFASAQSLNRADREQTPPPTATGVFALYTNDDTTAFGIGHSQTFKDDTYRLSALLADTKVNATYYVGDFPFGFSLEGNVVFGRLKRRFGHSNMFIGLSTSYLDGEIDFPIDPGPNADINIPGVEFTDVGVAGSVIYDSRDDTMMPTTGQLAELSLWRYDEDLGGDFGNLGVVDGADELGHRFGNPGSDLIDGDQHRRRSARFRVRGFFS